MVKESPDIGDVDNLKTDRRQCGTEQVTRKNVFKFISVKSGRVDEYYGRILNYKRYNDNYRRAEREKRRSLSIFFLILSAQRRISSIDRTTLTAHNNRLPPVNGRENADFPKTLSLPENTCIRRQKFVVVVVVADNVWPLLQSRLITSNFLDTKKHDRRRSHRPI